MRVGAGSAPEARSQVAVRRRDLARENERLRRTIEGLDAIVIVRAADEPAAVSPQVERILGVDAAAVADEAAWRALVHPDDVDTASRAWADPSNTWSVAYRMRRADGAWIWVRDHGRRTRADGHGSAHSVVTDITEYRLAAEGVARAARLESLGRLATGVAHDFENVLYGIDTLATWIAAHADHADVATEAANIAAAAQAGQAMTQALLAFAQGGGTERRPLDPVAFVRETAALLELLLGPSISLTLDLPDRQPRVVADRAGFRQALINLAVNARDAMPDGGVLAIGLKGQRLDAARARRLGVAPGRYVCLSVSDTGSGIPADVIDHIFEPFFTTKPMNIGTGLGLSTTYAFARANAGAVSVESAAGQGTRFRVYLPAW
ncbi:MAG: ATP-binding protein [Chloroflexota bacterium]